MKQLYTVVLFVLVFSPLLLPAQTQDTTEMYSIGGFAGYNLNFHSADFAKLPGVPGNSPGYTGGNGGGFTIGGLFEYPLSQLMRLQLRASFGSLSGSMTTQANPGNQIGINNPDGLPVTDVIIEHRMRGNLNAIIAEPALSVKLAGRFSVQAGAAVGFLIKNEFEQEEVIIQPASVTFLNNRTVMNDTSGTMPGDQSLFLAAIAGLSYELPAGKKTTLIPSIRYYLPFGDIASVPWKVSALQFSVALRTAITPSVPIPVIQDTIYIRDTTTTVIAGLTERTLNRTDRSESFAELQENGVIIERTTIREQYIEEVPRSFQLASSLTVTGLLADGSRAGRPGVTIEETELEETFPLLPYVFFGQGSAELSSTRTRIMNSQQAQQFRVNDLPSDALGIYAYNLNIIGLRLRDNPRATVIITGCNNDTGEEKNNTALSEARAKVVRDYLVTVWNVRAEQITVRAQNLPDKPANNDVEDGQAENRRVEITSASYDILQPVSIREISKAATPPVLVFTPTVQSEGGVDQWQLTLRQGNRQIREFRENGEPEEQRWEVMQPPIPDTEEPVVAVLSVIDRAGQRTESTQDVPVRQLTINKKRVEIKDDKRIEIFSLILFDFGKADISPLNRKIMDEVRNRIEPNSTVAVYGYADRTGSAEYNKELAQRRCNEVTKFLRDTITDERLRIYPVGNDRLLYNNGLPEGRSYSRTVQIVIETPVR